MVDVVNLTNLRNMTDGDVALEKELFDEFYRSFERGLALLHEYLKKNSVEEWRKQSHALKGISINLGAEKLASLCKQSQEQFEAGDDAKHKLLEEIQAEYALVKPYLQAVHT